MATSGDEFAGLHGAAARKGLDDVLGGIANFEREHLSTPEDRTLVLTDWALASRPKETQVPSYRDERSPIASVRAGHESDRQLHAQRLTGLVASLIASDT
jgi:hypothetical protein